MATIKFEVPLDNSEVLREVGQMLLRLAGTGDYVEGVTREGQEVHAQAAVVAPPAPATLTFDTFVDNVVSQIATAIDVPVETLITPAPPTHAPTAPPAPATGVELDAEGLPWDARIHVATKTKRQSDNTWTLKKSIDKDLVEQVKAELRGVMALPAPAAVAAPPAPAAVAAPPAPASGVPVPSNYAELVMAITYQQNLDKITFTEINEIVQRHGFTNLPLVNSRQDLIPVIFADLEKVWNSR